MIDLSVIIPARNEIFLLRTIEDILQNKRGNTEVIAICDGYWPEPQIPVHPLVTLIHHEQSVGQRAATNEGVHISQAQFVMKVDAHCAFDEGFDVKLLADMRPDWTMAPVMRNLHAFDWVCKNGHRRYQGPSGVCQECGEPTERDVVWIAKTSPQSTAYRFDRDLHFQYWGDFKRQQEGDLVESMSLQGSCFLVTREKFIELDLCDEKHGSWGQQGTEVACKTWLSGGRVIISKKTWYAHMFRTQGGDFGFPYPNPGVGKAREYSRKLWLENKWEGAIYPLEYLLNKFKPIPDWHDFKPPSKAILYYTCNSHSLDIEMACRNQLKKAAGDIPIIAVSLNQPIEFGDENYMVEGKKSGEMMHRQILHGLEQCKAEIVYLCESDVMYHASHFNFEPKRKDVFYYNTNVWRMRYDDGHAVWTDDLQQVSGCCAYRELLLDFYRKRVAQIEQEGFNRHYEPGVKQTIYPRTKGGAYGTENRKAEYPNIDIRHGNTITLSKWSIDDFRNKEYAKGWKETDGEIEGWGTTAEIMEIIKKGTA